MIKLKFIYDLSIKNKIILIILLVTFLTLGLGFVFIANWNINRIKSEIQSNLVLNAKLVGNYCVVPLTFGDNEQAAEALSHLKDIEFIEAGYLFDREGAIFATYPNTLLKESILEAPTQQISTLKNGHFYVQESILYQNKIYGTIYIKASSKPLNDFRKTLIIMLSLLTLVLIFLSIILAGKMQQYISLPIINLKNHFEALTQTQDFSQKIEKYNNDEVGHLYDEFNSLITQIQSRSLERDNAEKQFRESQEKLNLALLGGDIGIWEWDLKTDLTVWDAKMEKMFGLKEGSFNQTFDAFKDCLHPEDIVLAENAIQNALSDIAPYDIIYRVVWKNEEIKFIRAKALISKNEEQNPVKMIGVCFDVTEIKEAEDELKKNRENLEDIVKERTKKLEAKNEELERFNELFEDREFRIKELRDELDDLKSRK